MHFTANQNAEFVLAYFPAPANSGYHGNVDAVSTLSFASRGSAVKVVKTVVDIVTL